MARVLLFGFAGIGVPAVLVVANVSDSLFLVRQQCNSVVPGEDCAEHGAPVPRDMGRMVGPPAAGVPPAKGRAGFVHQSDARIE